MTQKSEMRRRLEKLVKELEKTDKLMERASIASRDLMAVQEENKALMSEARHLARWGRPDSN